MTNEALQSLLDDMSLEEKVGQMIQVTASMLDSGAKDILTGPEAALGLKPGEVQLAGSVLGTWGAKKLHDLQRVYMDAHPHHIPLLFMLDVIHGMRTIFPAPLGMGATFDPALAQACAQAAAREAAVSGVHVTFAPMVDLVRDARWGRVMESTGEDPCLNSRFAEAFVRGLQGDGTDWHNRICACIKHFAAYGAPVAGRDYNTVELSEHTLREFYLPAYEAGIRAGAGMVMTSFNTINGVPASTNAWLLKTVLRDEMGFEGVLISDFSAIAETIAHGHAADKKEAACMAIRAGLDIDMMGGVYSADTVRELLAEGKITQADIDASVWRILKLKNDLGLFEHPYKDGDETLEKSVLLCSDHRALARKAAAESMVLLKNDGALPLSPDASVALIGPYTDSRQLMSSWAITGKEADCMTIQEAAEEVLSGHAVYAQGCPILPPSTVLEDFGTSVTQAPLSEEDLRAMRDTAMEKAKASDLVVMLLGEHTLQSGEATSRGEITVPDIQMDLFRAVRAVNPRIVTVIFSGRPLDLREISEGSLAVIEAWRPGTEGAHALMDILLGTVNPSGCLPMSFPYCVGQVPVSYNEYATGRPYRPGLRFVSRYLDIPNQPLYPFGYGGSYTTFSVSPVELTEDHLCKGGSIQAAVTVTNTGEREGTVTVQLYVRDVSASVVRPVRELKGAERVSLGRGESQYVSFTITEDMLRFYRADGTFGSEPGTFHVWIGTDSTADGYAQFVLEG